MKKLPALPPPGEDDVSVNAAPTLVPVATPAPLTLDWCTLYRARLELDRRWDGTAAASEPRVTALSGHADRYFFFDRSY